jgi:hypothetical protein
MGLLFLHFLIPCIVLAFIARSMRLNLDQIGRQIFFFFLALANTERNKVPQRGFAWEELKPTTQFQAWSSQKELDIFSQSNELGPSTRICSASMLFRLRIQTLAELLRSWSTYSSERRIVGHESHVKIYFNDRVVLLFRHSIHSRS